MSLQIVLEVDGQAGVQALLRALEAYEARLQASISRGAGKLHEFEQRYNVTTERFLLDMAAEDLSDGDLEYVEWAGEARLLGGLEAELRELESVRRQLP
ncbi:MAG: hypothetical protein M3014_00490 [Chloroflexota bacterium]|nr:hypothetical protein [Chloroflexota bacterium]